MHILHALTHSSLGGGQAVPYLLIKNLQKFHPEIRHTVMMPAGGHFVDRFKNLSVEVVTFPFNSIRAKSFFHIGGILRSLNPSVIHSHGRGAGLYIRSISPVQMPAKRVHTHHGFHLPDRFPANMAFIAAEGYFLKNTDRIVSVSQSEAEVIIKSNPASKEKIRVIENIVDKSEVLAASTQSSAAIGEMEEFFKGKFVVTMIGRDDPIKNYSLAFKTAHKSLKINDLIVFIFIGIERENPDLIELLKRYPRNIKVLPPMENPLPVLARSSVLLLTSKREAGAPLVMMEAACLGVPTIGVRVRGLQESIRHGENGLCVEPDEEGLSEALLRSAGDMQLMSLLQKGALSFAGQFDGRAWSERYFSLYRELLQS